MAKVSREVLHPMPDCLKVCFALAKDQKCCHHAIFFCFSLSFFRSCITKEQSRKKSFFQEQTKIFFYLFAGRKSEQHEFRKSAGIRRSVLFVILEKN